jgi:hypothetical protein
MFLDCCDDNNRVVDSGHSFDALGGDDMIESAGHCQH